jgi:FkbM family methyltransferase
MVDVAPLSVRSLIGEYGNNPKITIVQAAVGLEREWITFHTSDDATTTSDEAMFLRWNGTVQFTGKMTVSAVTLEDIGTRFGSDFDFVSIDTEGTSYLLFKRMMQLGWEPRCVCCENDGQVNEMQSFAAQYGYTRTLLTGENGVFVK